MLSTENENQYNLVIFECQAFKSVALIQRIWLSNANGITLHK